MPVERRAMEAESSSCKFVNLVCEFGFWRGVSKGKWRFLEYKDTEIIWSTTAFALTH